MEVFGFIGASGTGKSHHALVVAYDHDIQAIIDDGLLIDHNRIVAGRSAKEETNRLKAVRRAIFNKPEDVARLKEGSTYNVSVNIESREYNGRWYTDIRAWRLQPKQEAAAAPMPDMPPIPEEPSYASSPAEVDDLPF